MKLTLTPPGLAAFLLCDDTVSVVPGNSWPNGAGGASKEGAVVPKTRFKIQETPLFRASGPFMAPRYNMVTAFSLTVQREFSNIAACYTFKNTHAATVPASGELCEYNGTNNLYLPLTYTEVCDIVIVNGVSCDTTYNFRSPSTWRNAP